MRANTIKSILNPDVFEVIDTHIPFFKTNSIFRSFGFRYKIGPLIAKTNTFIVDNLRPINFDLIWVDKGVFITPKTVKLLKSCATRFVHFTPDMAFYANKSKLFNKSIHYYDYLITTKSQEVSLYENYVSDENIILTTQGFDKQIHKPTHNFEEKDNAIVFIGLAEPSRIEIAEYIIKQNLTLKLVGKGWESFVEKHKENKNLEFYGDSVYSEAYSKLISSSKFALGLLSKQFPELHTTRTFEIPACGTALLTEKNSEILSFFNDNEVIFYDNYLDLVDKLNYFNKNQSELEKLINSGYEKVLNNSYDYKSIIGGLLKSIMK
jgi:spore maturation protein CgeB